MDRHILNIRGFSLIELSIVMGVIAVMATAITPVAIRSIEIKAGEKVVSEMVLIQEASRRFYKDYKIWPTNLSQLQAQGYVGARWSLLNPWNNPYQIISTAKTLSVATETPPNLTKMIAQRLTQSSINGTVINSVIGVSTEDFVSPGVIVAWSGAIVDIPQGWGLCDGTNGTPDLRDKFIVGARQDDQGLAKTALMGPLSKTGGTISHNHGGETGSHTLSIAEIPSHQHAGWGEAFSELAPWGVAPYGNGHLGARNSDYDNYYYLSSPTGGGQGHTHAISSDYHVPPYYALAFIMKLP